MALAYIKSTIGGYMFDVIFKENYQFDNQITQNPVQSGASINDHVYQQPIVITFDVGTSDCLASTVSGQFSTLNSRSASAFQVLHSLWQNATVLQIDSCVSGAVFSWKNMIIRSLSITRDKTTHHAIKATVTMQQIIVTDAVDVGIAASGVPFFQTPATGSINPQLTDQTQSQEKFMPIKQYVPPNPFN